MSYNYCKDHRSGITYVYDVVSQTDENGIKNTTRKLIGKLNQQGELIPTSGRRGRLPKNRGTSPTSEQDERLQKQISELTKEITELREKVASLQKEKQYMIKGMQKLLAQMQ